MKLIFIFNSRLTLVFFPFLSANTRDLTNRGEMSNESDVNQLSDHIDRGWDLAQKGDVEGAVACARKALEISPQSAEGYNLLGFSTALTGESEEALQHYKRAITLDKTYFDAMLNAAELMMHPLGKFDAAIDMCNEAEPLAGSAAEKADCLLLKMDAFLSKDNKGAAERLLAQIPPETLSDPQYAFMVGRGKYEVGDLLGAAPLIERAALAMPEHSDAWYYLGIVRDELGDTRGSVEAFLRSRAIDTFLLPQPWAPKPEAFSLVVKNVLKKIDIILAKYIERADIYIVDLPGSELVVDGVDPRALMLLDAPQGLTARLFVYQRNVERNAGTASRIEAELIHAIERELTLIFTTPEQKNVGKSLLN